MAINIEKTLIADYGKGKNYSNGRSQKVRYVVEHHTATMASAWNNLKYFASKYVGASAHYFIDRDGRIYQSVREKDTAWSVGASKYKHANARNSNSVNIEYISDGRAFTEEQIAAGAALTQDIIKRYGLPQSAILRHYDVTGKKCPGHYVNATRWKTLLARLKAVVAKPKPVVKPAPKPVAGKTIDQMAQEVIAGKHGSGHGNRQKSLGISLAEYTKVRDRVNAILSSKATPKPAPAAAKPAPKPAAPKASYYPRYTGKSPSIVGALAAVKVSSTFANRKKIAEKNGIKNYAGTAAQNTKILSLLKAGKLKK